MEREKIAALLKRLETGYSLPALSPVALKLVELASDEKSSARDLVELIEKDPPLAVRLLRLANSAFFSSAHTITTLNQAVIKVGFQRLRIMALSISLRDTFPMGRIGALDYEYFWRTSLYRALIAKSLANHLEGVGPEEAFISGLILEIGFLLFFDLFIRDYNQDIHFEIEPVNELLLWEQKNFGVDHRALGKIAMKFWNFPENIINCQKSYTRAPETDEETLLLKLSRLSGTLTSTLFLENIEFSTIYTEAKKELGIDQGIINDMLVETFDQLEVIAENLNVELDREKDLMTIMEKANQALSRLSDRIPDDHISRDSEKLPSFETICQNNENTSRTLQAVAHEIRNPILAVGGFAKKLSLSLDPVSKGGNYARIILEEAERLEKVLAEMITSEKNE